MYSTLNLLRWPIVSPLKPDFVSQIHMLMVFGNYLKLFLFTSLTYLLWQCCLRVETGQYGDKALIVTKDKMMYALGNNEAGCLGTGDTYCLYLFLKKIDILCKKDIKTFACGNGPHVLALTKGGEVCWKVTNEYLFVVFV